VLWEEDCRHEERTGPKQVDRMVWREHDFLVEERDLSGFIITAVDSI